MKTSIACLTIMIVVIFTGLSCQNVESPLADPEVELVGPTWQLTTFVEADGNHITIDRNRDDIPQAAYSVVFTKQLRKCEESLPPCGQWQMEAIGHPNQGGFSYNIHSKDSKSLTIYFHGQTKIGLPEGSKEPEFFDALKAAAHYRINGTQLRFFYGDDGKALLFEPLDSAEDSNDNRGG